MYVQWAQLEELHFKLCKREKFVMHLKYTLNLRYICMLEIAAITVTCTPVSRSCFNLILCFLYYLF